MIFDCNMLNIKINVIYNHFKLAYQRVFSILIIVQFLIKK